MKKNILMRTNLLVCVIIIVGFFLTALLSYRANIETSLKSIEQVSALTSEGIYYQMSTTFSKPLNISQTMANDSLLHEFLQQEPANLENPAYAETIKEYLYTYQDKYGYDSVFLVSAATSRYYNFNGLDRVLERGDPEDVWYFDELLDSNVEYTMNVDNDQVAGADNAITVFVNCKIRDGAGLMLGVVGVGVRIDGLQRTLQDYQAEFAVNAYLIDDEGTIELSSSHSGYEKINLFEVNGDCYETARQDILAWKQDDPALSFWALDRSGQKRDYIVARYLPDIRWHLVVERDTGEMVSEMHWQIVLTAAVIVFILGSILVIITKLIRRFNRQIVDMTKALEQERQALFEKATEQLFENIYEIDVTRNLPANEGTRAYFESLGAPAGCTFDKALQIIAEKQIKEEFRQGYLSTFLPDRVLRAFESGTDSLTYEFMITKDGEHYYWMRITARIVPWTDGSVHMLVYRQNIDAEKRQERKMQKLAHTDEMTGLMTKTETHRLIAELLEKTPGAPFAYFIFDIDNFKQANDQCGHVFGDSVICTFVETLRQNFRRDDVLGRVGGDEFVAFFPCETSRGAEEKAASLCRALCFTHTMSGMSWQVSVSIGVTLTPEHGADAHTLYEHADEALYRTKRNGRNGYTIYTEGFR